MPKWSEQINHLSYENDTIIFISADKIFLQLGMHTLCDYELQLEQNINKAKSFFYVHNKICRSIVQEIKGVTGLNKGKFPFTYLG